MRARSGMSGRIGLIRRPSPPGRIGLIRRPSPPGVIRLLGPLGLLGLLGPLAACNAAGADGSERGVEYRPAASVPRLAAMPLDGDDIGLVRDFDMSGDTVYLLDGGGRVVVLVRSASGLRVSGHFSRRGAGPGELMQPIGIALAGADVLIADGARLQFFSRRGEFLTSKRLDPPCVMMLPKVAPATEGLFLHGGCVRRGNVTDTMKAVLAWSADTTHWEVVLETPRFTTDASIGSAFGASSLMTTGITGRHVFGGGESNCIWSIEDAGRPTATPTCPAVTTLYAADPPPGLERTLRSSRFAGMKLRWPESLPAYSDRFVADGAVVLVRPFTADSMVLQLAAPASADIAVAPQNGFIGCKAGGCVWLIEEDETPRLIVLYRTELDAMVRRQLEAGVLGNRSQ